MKEDADEGERTEHQMNQQNERRREESVQDATAVRAERLLDDLLAAQALDTDGHRRLGLLSSGGGRRGRRRRRRGRRGRRRSCRCCQEIWVSVGAHRVQSEGKEELPKALTSRVLLLISGLLLRILRRVGRRGPVVRGGAERRKHPYLWRTQKGGEKREGWKGRKEGGEKEVKVEG